MTGWVWENEKYVSKKDATGPKPTLNVNITDGEAEPLLEQEPVSIPLETQLWMYEQMAELSLDNLIDILLLPETREEVVEMAKNRLAGGFPVYGCTMYNWDAKTRRRNLLEELADASVYFTGGPID